MVVNLFGRDRIYSPGQRLGNYTVMECIGEGKYGICYIVSKNNRRYILKQLKTRLFRKVGFKAEIEEELLSSIEHDCIPKFIEKIERGNLTGYILEFKEGKTFEEIVFKDKYIFSREEIYKVSQQLIDIIKYLHEKSVIHRDIRLPNVIYNEGKVFLVDFGLSRWSSEKYKQDIDFSYLGDFLLHLYYTSYKSSGIRHGPWYTELDLQEKELLFLRKLMGIDERYKDIFEVEKDFLQLSLNNGRYNVVY